MWLRPTNLTHADKIPSSRALSTTHAEVFDVTKHGAKGDGRSRDDDAIQATFAACATSSAIGPREVLFPAPGTYVTGPWELACNNSVVTVQQGASVVSFTANGSTRGWPLGPLTSPEPSQGLTDKQATPFILAHYVHNVTLRGGGTLDAGGKPFWQERCGNWWCPKWAPGVSPKKPYAWRPFMLRIDHSADVTVDGLRFEATAFWCIVPVRSQRIEISNVTIYARDGDGATPNTDGIEPMWTKDVHIHDVKIDNGDDCVTIKSGSSDIVVERLDCTHSHGITIGSIWYDDVTNVTYRQVHLHDCRCGPRIKGREQGNATISDIHFEDIVMDNTATAGICVDMTYETPGSTHKNLGCTAQGVAYTNVTGSVGQSIGSLECLPTRPCSVTMNDIEITSKFKHATWKCKSVHAVPEGSIEPPLPSACNITDNDGR
eukprot:COSAG05_NODE_7_length_42457_cov_58.929152_14_plen_432_part_00